MKTCGIELKGNDAILVCLEGNTNAYAFAHKEVKKIKLQDSNNQSDIKVFSKAVIEFLNTNQFDSIGIKARATKGRFSGGSVSFKMEGIIQLADSNVQIIHGATIKAKMKTRLDEIDGAQLNTYQKEAFTVALYLLS